MSRLRGNAQSDIPPFVSLRGMSIGSEPGFLGVDTVRGPDGLGITVAYFTDDESIANWKANAEHALAQKLGREKWYDSYALHIGKVERAYRFDR